MHFQYPYDSTKLTPDQTKGLLPKNLLTMAQLNEWEQENIFLAEQWAFRNIKKLVINLEYIKKLNKKMFDKTWKWAGQFRQTDTNIGINWPTISTELYKLCQDLEYQLSNNSYPLEEMLARFHHRLVWIHPFPNGNGRHARLMTDLILFKINGTRFFWGANLKFPIEEIRKLYIQSLKAADTGSIQPLLNFMQK